MGNTVAIVKKCAKLLTGTVYFIYISLTISLILVQYTREINRKNMGEAQCHTKQHFPVLRNWILDRFIAFLHIFAFPVARRFIARSLYVLLSFLNNRYK